MSVLRAQIVSKYRGQALKYPHKLTIVIWPEDPVTKLVDDFEQLEDAIDQFCVEYLNHLAQFEPSVAVVFNNPPLSSIIEVNPPTEVLAKSGSLH